MIFKTFMGGACLILSFGAQAAPFPTRDQNPLLAGLAMGLPLPAEVAAADTTGIGLAFNWSNTANSRQAGAEAILADLESRELRLTVERGLTDRWAMRVQLPYRHLDAGVLDSFIDTWHDTFGMPEGARVFLPRDQFRLAWFRDGQPLVDLREPVGGIGDIALDLGYQLRRDEGDRLSFWMTVEAPTGSRRDLLGNGAWDVSLSLVGSHSFGTRGTAFWQAGATYLGSDGPLAPWRKEWVGALSGSIEYGVWRNLFLKAQVDAHTAAYDSELDLLGSATILTVGGDYRFASGWLLDVGISEDIEVAASPDVTFLFGLRRVF